jgi:hypothetical protein
LWVFESAGRGTSQKGLQRGPARKAHLIKLIVTLLFDAEDDVWVLHKNLGLSELIISVANAQRVKDLDAPGLIRTRPLRVRLVGKDPVTAVGVGRRYVA